MDLKTLLERAKQGQKLSKPDRIRALRYLEAHENLNSIQLAELLQVSDRQLRRDRIEVKAQLKDEAEARDLFSELIAAHRWGLCQVRRGLRETKPGTASFWKGIQTAWTIERDFWDRWRDRELLARVQRLEEAVITERP